MTTARKCTKVECSNYARFGWAYCGIHASWDLPMKIVECQCLGCKFDKKRGLKARHANLTKKGGELT